MTTTLATIETWECMLAPPRLIGPRAGLLEINCFTKPLVGDGDNSDAETTPRRDSIRAGRASYVDFC